MNLRPFVPIASLAVLGLLAANAGAQTQGGLLFTTLSGGRSTQCGAATGALSTVSAEEVQFVSPPATGPYSSMAFATQNGYGELLGDLDGDGNYWVSRLFVHNEALVCPRDLQGAPLPVDVHSLFFSSHATLTSPAGAVAMSDDVFRILPGGALEFFLTGAQVKTAFGISSSTSLDVDAATLSFDPQLGGVFLSIELGRLTHFGFASDSDILRIPMSALTLAPSPYDGASLVVAVVPNSGVLQHSSTALNAMCVASGVSSPTGAAVTTVGDIDGLAWNEQTGALWFSGTSLFGGAVLSTAGGGSIAVLNGRPLAQTAPAPTTGAEIGMLPGVRDLDGLALVSQVNTFVTDTRNGNGPGALVTVEAGGAPSGAPVWFLLNLVPDAPGGPADPAAPFANPAFPLLYPFLTHIGPSFAGADGCVSETRGPAPPLSGWHISAQAVTLDATYALLLSTPIVIDL